MVGDVISEALLSAADSTEFGLLPLKVLGPADAGRSPTRSLTRFSTLSRLYARGMGAVT